MEMSDEDGFQDPARKKEEMRQSLNKWNAEREKNEEYIEQLRRRKEERKREIEAEQARILSMKEEDEEEAAKAEEDLLKIDDSGKDNPDGKSKQKANFADQKKFKTKEEREYYEALTTLIKPFDVKTMDTEQLKSKVAELYDIFTNLINDKINLNKQMVDQDRNIKDLKEKLTMILDERASKKGGIDMEKFYPGKKNHPAKLTIFSKYDNRKGTRTYDDRKEMYDVGTDVVRPKMLVDMWQEKFNAWMNSDLDEQGDDE